MVHVEKVRGFVTVLFGRLVHKVEKFVGRWRFDGRLRVSFS